MGPGTRGKQTSLVLFLFCFRERDVNERAGSGTGEAGFNEIRVQFTMQGGHGLIAIHYIYYMPRGYRSRHRDTHEIMLSVLYLCFGVSRLATKLHYTELCTRDNMRMD